VGGGLGSLPVYANALTTGAELPGLGYVAGGLGGLGSVLGGGGTTLGSSLASALGGMPGKMMDAVSANPAASLATLLGGLAGGLSSGSSPGETMTRTNTMDPLAWQYAQPALQTGLGMLPSQLSTASGVQGQALGALGGLLNAPNLNSNPWASQYADALSDQTWNDWTTRGAPALASQFSGAGRYGSGAYGLAQGQAAGDVSRGLATARAGLLNQQYGQGLNAAGQGLSLAPSTAQLGYQPLQNYMSMLGQVPWGSSATQTGATQYSSPWAGALGGALTGASLWKALSG
jgi:hypothetical protein